MPDPIRLGDPKPVLLHNWYANLIESGDLPPGTPLTTRRICAEHGVTPRTANQALHLLADAGLVEIRHGRGGTVVLAGREGTVIECDTPEGRSNDE